MAFGNVHNLLFVTYTSVREMPTNHKSWPCSGEEVLSLEGVWRGEGISHVKEKGVLVGFF